MTQPDEQQPYIPVKPGDLITAEDLNEIQQHVRADLAANAADDAKNVADLKTMITNVDAPKFGGKTPDDWTDDLDKRYIRRDDPQAAGQYRRYFKQLNRKIAGDGGTTSIEPAVIKHGLCRYPIAEIYELMPLFSFDTAPDADQQKKLGLPDNWQTVKFLVYYASKRDPVSDLLFSESDDRYYWGDPIQLLLEQFNVHPAMTQSFDDLLNDLWGKMFDPGNEQDEFDRDSYGNSPYTQNWIDKNNSTVGDLTKGGQWDNLRLAIRPRLIATGGLTVAPNADLPQSAPAAEVFHLSQNELEIRVPQAAELMVLIRT